MEVTPEAVREGRFREALRGYNRDDVDEFLEQLASGIAVLQERVRQATDRAVRAEAKASEAAEVDESLKRTLVLAQRTADLAVEEARREAAGLIEEAEARHAALVGEVEEERQRLFDDVHRRMREEVDALYEAREQLQADVVALDAFVDGQRERLRATLREALNGLDNGLPLLEEPPAVHEVEVPSEPIPPVEVPAVADAAEVVGASANGEHAAREPEAEHELDVRDDDDAFLAELHNAVVEEAAEDEAAAEEAQEESPRTPYDLDLADDDVLPPPDERARAFFDEDDDSARRFGSLRRRRR